MRKHGTARQLSSARAKPEGGTTSTTSTSMRRVDGVLAFVESGKPSNFFVSDEVCASTEKFTLLAFARDNLSREADEAVAADHFGHLRVVRGVHVIVDAFHYSFFSARGTAFASTRVERVVPVRAILALDLHLASVAIAAHQEFNQVVLKSSCWQVKFIMLTY